VDYAGYIETSGQHLLSLINDILDISKIEAGKVELERVRLDFRFVINSVLVLVRETARRRKVVLTVHFAPEAPPSVWADERALKQILFNLIANAVKFTPPDGSISVSAREDEAGWTEIIVADTGIGIPPDQIERILKPFEQLDNGYNRTTTGTGLGLSLVQSLVTLHGGRIIFQSSVGTGTTVTVFLPPAPSGDGHGTV